MENLSEYMETSQLIDWAKANLNIIKLSNEMTDADIRRIVHWVGLCAVDTVFVDGDKPILEENRYRDDAVYDAAGISRVLHAVWA